MECEGCFEPAAGVALYLGDAWDDDDIFRTLEILCEDCLIEHCEYNVYDKLEVYKE